MNLRRSFSDKKMKLSNSLGSVVELRVVGYQFPQYTDYKYDSNWLLICINATKEDRSWTATSPCLLTWEVEALALWLEKLGAGQPTRSRLSFMEPVLEFQVIKVESGNKAIRLYFELDSRPDWTFSQSAEQKNLWIDFPLSEIDVHEAVESLRQQLGMFPKRAAVPR